MTADKMLTLRAFYNEKYRPIWHDDAKQSTIDEYKWTLRKWEKFTCNPLLCEISASHLAEFKTGLKSLPGRKTEKVSPHTVNKHLRHVQAILAKTGPSCSRNRDAMHIIERVPWIRPSKAPRTFPRNLSIEELRAVYEAAPTAEWRALIMVAAHAGSRVHAILSMTDDQIDFSNAVWTIPASIDKMQTERKKPLSAALRAELMKIRRPGKYFDLNHHRRQFYDHWSAIRTAAKVQCTPHDLKRTCSNLLKQVGVGDSAIKYMLDHVPRDVTGISYFNPFDELRKAVDRLPSPPDFDQGGPDHERNHRQA